MIVLAAVHLSRWRPHLVRQGNYKLTKHDLSLLFRRTIKVLRTVGKNSPTLQVDADILENVRRNHDLYPDEEASNGP
jgi:hypothetical protein